VEGKGMWQDSQLDLNSLYMIAYIGYSHINPGLYTTADLFGKVWRRPVLEFIDSTSYEKFRTDKVTGSGYYTYSLTVPRERATVTFMSNLMKQDLQNYFGFKARLEDRMMPVWKLVVVDTVKVKSLKSTGSVSFQNKTSDKYQGFDGTNVSVKTLIKVCMTPIYHISDKSYLEDALVDETGIQYNIDIAINASMTDFTEVRTELNKNGFDIIKGVRDMKVLIITDR
jgi:hypothetical protein